MLLIALAMPAACVASSDDDGDESLEDERAIEAAIEEPTHTAPPPAPTGGPSSISIPEGYGEALVDLGEGMLAYEPEIRIVDDAPIDPELEHRPRGRVSGLDSEARRAQRASVDREMVRALGRDRGAAVLRFEVNLADPGFDLRTLAREEDDVRQAAIAARKESLRPSQESVTAAIEALGGTVVERRWVINSLVVEAAGDDVDAIVSLPAVESAKSAETTVTPAARYDGTDTRAAVRTEAMRSYGHYGETEGRTAFPSNTIKIGIFDVDPLNTTHVGWLDWAGGPTRVKKKAFCSGGACVASGAAAAGIFNHGTRVASVAAGDISQGQDANFPGFNTAAQREHSWSASDADIYYYWGDPATAIEAAIADGVDVLNMSVAISCGGAENYLCSPNYDCSNINALLRGGLDAGMVTTVASGNGSQGGAGTCDLAWPGYRPETIGVNSLNTSNDAVAYHDTVFTAYATTGPIPIVSYGGVSSATPGVDLLAPGEVRYAFGNGTNTYFDMNGSSNATPVVAGALGLMREAFKDLGWLGNDARALMVNAFVLGDASNGTANGESNNQVHNSAGFGRLHLHKPSSQDLVAPWGWGWRAVVIQDGQELAYSVWDTGPESPAVTEWKMAVMWDAPDLENVPDIVVRVVDTCNGGATVLSDYSYAPRKRLHLTAPQIGGKCLEMRVLGWDVPPGGTVVYMADYFHAGDTNIH